MIKVVNNSLQSLQGSRSELGLQVVWVGLFFSLSFSSGHQAPCFFFCEHLKALSYLKGLRKPALRVVPILKDTAEDV